jgi:hypothetical protein
MRTGTSQVPSSFYIGIELDPPRATEGTNPPPLFCAFANETGSIGAPKDIYILIALRWLRSIQASFAPQAWRERKSGRPIPLASDFPMSCL